MFNRTQQIAIAGLEAADIVVQDREKYMIDFTTTNGDGTINFEATSMNRPCIKFVSNNTDPYETIKILRRKK